MPKERLSRQEAQAVKLMRLVKANDRRAILAALAVLAARRSARIKTRR